MAEGQDLKGTRTDGGVTREPIGSWLWRLWWLAVLAAHLLAGAAWWFLAPGGFRPDHPRFWTNEVAPIAIVGLAVLCLWFVHRERMDGLRPLLPAWAAAWTGLTLAMVWAFPMTMARIGPFPAGLSLAMGFSAIGPWRRGGPGGRRVLVGSLAIAVASAIMGTGFALSLRPPARIRSAGWKTPISEIRRARTCLTPEPSGSVPTSWCSRPMARSWRGSHP